MTFGWVRGYVGKNSGMRTNKNRLSSDMFIYTYVRKTSNKKLYVYQTLLGTNYLFMLFKG